MSLFHTPGPWKARKIDDQCWAIDSNGDPNIGHESWTDMVIVHGCDDEPDQGSVVSEANARLIAAAPELLEACQTFAEWLRRESADTSEKPWRTKRGTPEGEAAWLEWFYENMRICDLAQEQARAAIAKATGARA